MYQRLGRYEQADELRDGESDRLLLRDAGRGLPAGRRVVAGEEFFDCQRSGAPDPVPAEAIEPMSAHGTAHVPLVLADDAIATQPFMT